MFLFSTKILSRDHPDPFEEGLWPAVAISPEIWGTQHVLFQGSLWQNRRAEGQELLTYWAELGKWGRMGGCS